MANTQPGTSNAEHGKKSLNPTQELDFVTNSTDGDDARLEDCLSHFKEPRSDSDYKPKDLLTGVVLCLSYLAAICKNVKNIWTKGKPDWFDIEFKKALEHEADRNPDIMEEKSFHHCYTKGGWKNLKQPVEDSKTVLKLRASVLIEGLRKEGRLPSEIGTLFSRWKKNQDWQLYLKKCFSLVLAKKLKKHLEEINEGQVLCASDDADIDKTLQQHVKDCNRLCNDNARSQVKCRQDVLPAAQERGSAHDQSLSVPSSVQSTQFDTSGCKSVEKQSSAVTARSQANTTAHPGVTRPATPGIQNVGGAAPSGTWQTAEPQISSARGIQAADSSVPGPSNDIDHCVKPPPNEVLSLRPKYVKAQNKPQSDLFYTTDCCMNRGILQENDDRDILAPVDKQEERPRPIYDQSEQKSEDREKLDEEGLPGVQEQLGLISQHEVPGGAPDEVYLQKEGFPVTPHDAAGTTTEAEFSAAVHSQMVISEDLVYMAMKEADIDPDGHPLPSAHYEDISLNTTRPTVPSTDSKGVGLNCAGPTVPSTDSEDVGLNTVGPTVPSVDSEDAGLNSTRPTVPSTDSEGAGLNTTRPTVPSTDSEGAGLNTTGPTVPSVDSEGAGLNTAGPTVPSTHSEDACLITAGPTVPSADSEGAGLNTARPTVPSTDSEGAGLNTTEPTVPSADSEAAGLNTARHPVPSTGSEVADLNTAGPTVPSTDSEGAGLNTTRPTVPSADSEGAGLNTTGPTVPSADSVGAGLNTTGPTVPSADSVGAGLNTTGPTVPSTDSEDAGLNTVGPTVPSTDSEDAGLNSTRPTVPSTDSEGAGLNTTGPTVPSTDSEGAGLNTTGPTVPSTDSEDACLNTAGPTVPSTYSEGAGLNTARPTVPSTDSEGAGLNTTGPTVLSVDSEGAGLNTTGPTVPSVDSEGAGLNTTGPTVPSTDSEDAGLNTVGPTVPSADSEDAGLNSIRPTVPFTDSEGAGLNTTGPTVPTARKRFYGPATGNGYGPGPPEKRAKLEIIQENVATDLENTVISHPCLGIEVDWGSEESVKSIDQYTDKNMCNINPSGNCI